VKALAAAALLLVGCDAPARQDNSVSQSAYLNTLAQSDAIEEMRGDIEALEARIGALEGEYDGTIALINRNVRVENGRNGAQNEMLTDMRERLERLESDQPWSPN
jgi:archaellum component FlaC